MAVRRGRGAVNGEFETQFYLHVRVLVGLVVGLGVTQCLSGLARFIQHPRERKIYWLHLVWVATALLSIMHFWWWEFALIRLHWNFALFAFVMFYAFLYYLLASLLFPTHITDYTGFEDYFFSRRAWIFGLLALLLVVDFVDTGIKGSTHLAALGLEYKLRLPALVAGCALAGWTTNRTYHAIFGIGYLAYLISWIGRLYWIAS